MTNHTDQFFVDSAQRTISMEADAVSALSCALGPPFAAACRYILGTTGRVVVTGMGKSGHIAGKIAATLASTGTPAFFVHPGEARQMTNKSMSPLRNARATRGRTGCSDCCRA